MIRALLLTLALAFSPLMSQDRIIETPHIADVIGLIDSDAWFLVDLDNTMFEAKQALGHVQHYYDELENRIQNGMARNQAVCDAYSVWENLQHACPVQPLEDDFIPILHELQKRGVVVMGLTHRHPSSMSATISQVESLGFDFTVTAPQSEVLAISSDHPALYEGGILFCSNFNLKSDIFLDFAATIEKCPKKIVFIDDRKNNVEEVVSHLSQLGIECIGIHYTAADYVKQVYNRKHAQFQAKHLGKIMSNEAAALLIEHGFD